MKPTLTLLTALLLAWVNPLLAVNTPRFAKPNVLFIAIDDMNDWIGHLGGHPLVKTPHLDRLAARGTTFLNAHVQSPICNPSRTNLMLGLRPSTTGIYGLAPWFRSLPSGRTASRCPSISRRMDTRPTPPARFTTARAS
jgi:arylsulfatase A-like enzyme